uniref:EAL domain-containing protein n=1 Tax=uncultured Faecalicoccus sp. TaxID=1971760 RepID=UPI002602E7E2
SEKKDSKSVMIMEEMIQLSKKLNLKTVVEGVETKENEEMIRQFGCDYAQGYYYSKPIPVDEFVQKYLRKPEEIL